TLYLPLSSLFLNSRINTSGWPISQKLSLLLRFFFRSSVKRSAFICALSSVTPGQFVSSMSFAASSSNWKAQNKTIWVLGFKCSASSNASSTVRCSSGACSGPKHTNTLFGLSSLVSASACKYRVPLSVSTLVNSINLPPLALTPARSNSSFHSLCLNVSPLRATDVSASIGVSLTTSSSNLATGAGTASTV